MIQQDPVSKLINLVSRLNEAEIQERFLSSTLTSWSAEELASLFIALGQSISRSSSRIVYQALLRVMLKDLALLRGAREQCYSICSLEGMGHMVRLFLPVAAQRAVGKGEVEGSPMLLDTPLGVKKWKARNLDRDILFHVSMDPDPSVIRILLNNPRTTEMDVIRLVSRRPHQPECLMEVVFSRRWSPKAGVLEAIVQNPYLYSHVAAAHLPLLNKSTLAAIKDNPSLHILVRTTADQLIQAG